MGDVTFTAMTTFESAMRMELNQQEALLAPTAKTRDCKGSEKKKLTNLIANQTMRKKTERHSTVVHDTTGWDGIWIAKPDPDYLATLVDNEDELVTMVDLEGGELLAHAGAKIRSDDSAFLQGFFGDMITGKTGTTLNAFPAGNVVAIDYTGPGVAALEGGMSVPKIRRARKILAQNYVNLQQKLYIAMTSQQIEDLTNDAKATDRDFLNANKPLWSEDGKFLMGLAGFTFIEIELSNPLLWAEYGGTDLTLAAGDDRKCPFFTEDAMVKGSWEELFTQVTKLPTQHYEAQVYSRTQRAFSRTDQNRCGYILCEE